MVSRGEILSWWIVSWCGMLVWSKNAIQEWPKFWLTFLLLFLIHRQKGGGGPHLTPISLNHRIWGMSLWTMPILIFNPFTNFGKHSLITRFKGLICNHYRLIWCLAIASLHMFVYSFLHFGTLEFWKVNSSRKIGKRFFLHPHGLG